MAGRSTARLRALAVPLEPRRQPFYVRLPVLPADEARYPAEGWYWQPKDYSYPVYLGATFEAAAFRLRSQQLKDDDAGS